MTTRLRPATLPVLLLAAVLVGCGGGGSSTSTGGGGGPVITGLFPASGPEGSLVLVSGTGIGTATAVTLGATAASFTATPDGRLLVAVPAGAASATLSVTAPGGSATSSTTFAVVPAPGGPGSWTVSGSLVTPRDGHTATLLGSGRILVVGGWTDATYSVSARTATAELYDPGTGTSAATGAMATARSRATAVLLQSGKVLVAGGLGGPTSSSSLASAELYDPATGTWSATGSMGQAKYGFSATLLPSGKVLVAGGYTGGAALSTTELYDPQTGAWTAGPALAGPRTGHDAILLPSGRVLLAGGGNSVTGLQTSEVYDPVAGSFTAGGSSAGAGGASLVSLPGGKVFYSGAETQVGGEVYSVATNAFTATTSTSGRSYFINSVAAAGGGKVVLAGNSTFPGGDVADVFTASTNTIAATGKLNVARGFSRLVLVPSGRLVLLGGRTSTPPYQPTASVEIYW